jgi:hypothetical protein
MDREWRSRHDRRAWDERETEEKRKSGGKPAAKRAKREKR